MDASLAAEILKTEVMKSCRPSEYFLSNRLKIFCHMTILPGIFEEKFPLASLWSRSGLPFSKKNHSSK